jgi:hypothetical protein
MYTLLILGCSLCFHVYDVKEKMMRISSNAALAKFELQIQFDEELIHTRAAAKFNRKRHQLTVRVPCLLKPKAKAQPKTMPDKLDLSDIMLVFQKQHEWQRALGAAKKALDASEDDTSRVYLQGVVKQAFLNVMYQDHVLKLKSQVYVRAYPGKGNGVEVTNLRGYTCRSVVFDEPVIAAGVCSSSLDRTICDHCLKSIVSSTTCNLCGAAHWCSKRCRSSHAAHAHLCRGYCFSGEEQKAADSRHVALKTAADRGHGIWIATQILAKLIATGHTKQSWTEHFGAMESGNWSEQDGNDGRIQRKKVHSERAILYLQYYNVHPLDSRMFTMFSCVGNEID